jgi:PDZ domain
MHYLNLLPRQLFITLGLLVSLSSFAQAELIQLTCEIRSIDANERSIVAFRAEKEIKLSLAENVSLTVNDQSMQIEDLPVPIEAAIEYETKLEVITKIAASKKVVLESLRFHLDQQGDLRVWVNGPNDPEVFQADSFFEPNPSFGDAEVEHQLGSLFRVRHDFSKQAANKVVTREGTDIAINPDLAVAVIVPQPDSINPHSLHRSLRAPFHVQMEFRNANAGQFHCILDSGTLKNFIKVDCGQGKVMVLSSNDGDSRPLGEQDLQFRQTEPLVVSLDKKTGTSLCNLQFALQGDQPIGILAIDVVGSFPASFGARIELKGENVMVVDVIEGSASEQKLQVGDIIQSVNRVPIVDLAGALALFGDCTLGKEVAIEVERLSETKTVMITPR